MLFNQKIKERTTNTNKYSLGYSDFKNDYKEFHNSSMCTISVQSIPDPCLDRPRSEPGLTDSGVTKDFRVFPKISMRYLDNPKFDD